ncbi:hypothetical protein M5K25_003794 [Dendrobium thyrsiflorum]|uniref:Uncharacterized protein n=1 Tax=Dendrobium thyrsiflorum TaxID=117978 RepID=A0ABD0VSF9_DENTH
MLQSQVLEVLYLLQEGGQGFGFSSFTRRVKKELRSSGFSKREKKIGGLLPSPGLDSSKIEVEEEVSNLCLMVVSHLDHSNQWEKEHEYLIKDHSTLDSNHMTLLDEFNSLNKKHSNLTVELDSLKAHYIDLESSFDNLKTSLDEADNRELTLKIDNSILESVNKYSSSHPKELILRDPSEGVKIRNGFRKEVHRSLTTSINSRLGSSDSSIQDRLKEEFEAALNPEASSSSKNIFMDRLDDPNAIPTLDSKINADCLSSVHKNVPVKASLDSVGIRNDCNGVIANPVLHESNVVSRNSGNPWKKSSHIKINFNKEKLVLSEDDVTPDEERTYANDGGFPSSRTDFANLFTLSFKPEEDDASKSFF